MNNHTKFAVQPLWSNRAFDVTGQGCVRSAATNPHAMPACRNHAPDRGYLHDYRICPPGVAAGQPMPVNMAYFGGKVQTKPKVYLVCGAGAGLARSITRHPPTLPAIPTVWAH